MTTDIQVLETKDCTIQSSTCSFNVTYITATDGRQFTVYENTPGFKLVVPQALLTLHYKENVKNGKVFNNCFRITPQSSTPKATGEEILDTLRNIQELLQHVLERINTRPDTRPSDTTPPTTPPSVTSSRDDDLPF